MKSLLLVPGVFALLGQSEPGGELPPTIGYGILGALISFVTWLLLDERKEHKALREKVIADVVPALIANNEALRDSAGAVVQIHQIASRPNIDPITFAQMSQTLARVERKLDQEHP